ncbi:hypothetical protein ACS7SF_12350 [Ralstonia sp. 25C]
MDAPREYAFEFAVINGNPTSGDCDDAKNDFLDPGACGRPDNGG